MLRRFASALVEFCYPTRCASCETFIDGTDPICNDCRDGLARLADVAHCPMCGMPLAFAGIDCAVCGDHGRSHYDRIVVLATFDDPIKSLIHRLKYHGRWTAADWIGDALVDHEPAKGLLQKTDLILAVPLHARRQLTRGYNQAALIAKRVARRCSIDYAEPAIRLRDTETQTHLHSTTQRVENLKDAFAVLDPRAITGRHVLVIDDVLTTGATLHAFGQTIRRAKPASLCAMTAAIADPKGRQFELL